MKGGTKASKEQRKKATRSHKEREGKDHYEWPEEGTMRKGWTTTNGQEGTTRKEGPPQTTREEPWESGTYLHYHTSLVETETLIRI